MSFPRAAIKRFNEPPDTGIPPPGAYDPKFVTDVAAVASTLKGGLDKWGRPPLTTTYANVFVSPAGAPPGCSGATSKRSRSSSRAAPNKVNDLVKTSRSRFSFNNANNSVASHSSTRISRNISTAKLSKKRSSTTGTQAGLSYPESSMLLNKPPRKPSSARFASSSPSNSKFFRPRSPSVARSSNHGLRRAPSTSSCPAAPAPFQMNEQVLTDIIKAETWETASSSVAEDKLFGNNNNQQQIFMKNNADLEPGEVYGFHQSTPHTTAALLGRSSSVSSAPNGNIFDEIQTLAENLQSELADYKLQLAKERIRSQELDAKKQELEFINQSFKRQLEKHEDDKVTLGVDELSLRFKLEEVTREKDELEKKLENLQRKLEDLEGSEFSLQNKVVCLEEEKSKWQQEKEVLEEVIEGSKRMLKDEQMKRSQVEDKIRQLESQMDTCYHSCESQIADTENMKETYEVKIQELLGQVGELENKLDGVRREMETQKTLMDMMKSEHEDKNKNKVDDAQLQNLQEQTKIFCDSLMNSYLN